MCNGTVRLGHHRGRNTILPMHPPTSLASMPGSKALPKEPLPAILSFGAVRLALRGNWNSSRDQNDSRKFWNTNTGAPRAKSQDRQTLAVLATAMLVKRAAPQQTDTIPALQRA